MVVPFDPFTQPPRNKREFGIAMKAQGEAILDNSARSGKPLGFAVTAAYLTETVGITDPVKAIELLWRSLPYDQFRIWLDGRSGVFMVEAMAPVADQPKKKSSIILPRHLNG